MADYGTGAAPTGGGMLNTGEWKNTTYYQTGSGTYEAREPVFTPVASLMNLPNTLFAQGNFAGMKQIQELVKAGGFSSWEEALQFAAQDPEKGSRSYMDFLTDHAQRYQAFLAENGDGTEGTGGGGSGGPFSYSETTTSLTSESGSAGILDQVFQSELGRMATEQEIKAFQKALNAQQQQAPATSVSSGNVSGNNRTTNTTSTSQFDPARFAMEWARSRPEYAEVTAATTFMDLIDRAIADPNALDQMIAGN